MKKIIALFILFLSTSLFGADFEAQNDSYFAPVRTKIFWSLSTGISSGSSRGFLGMDNGTSANLELFRFVGRIKPEPKFFEYFWSTFDIDYNLFEDGNNIYEIVSEDLLMGVGIKLGDEGVWKNIIPYIGGGAGYGVILSRNNINSAPSFKADHGMIYAQSAGIEFKILNVLTLFIEEKYMWGGILSKDNYIPDKYSENNYKSSIPASETFVRNTTDLSQFIIRTGIRFYWGQNMFSWPFPFFWEK